MRAALVIALIGVSAAWGCARLSTTSPASAVDQPLRANVLLDGGQVLLPNGWKITPAGHATQLPGDMPERILFTPDGKYLLVNTGGYNEHGISLLDATTGKLLHHVAVPRTFVGMCLDPTGTHVYLSAGQTMDMRDNSNSADTHGPAIRRF